MITPDNFKAVLIDLGFTENNKIFEKSFAGSDTSLKVDFKNKKLIYPEDKGFTINERQTCNFDKNENFVVFECVHRLLEKGYKPEHIELEPRWKLGHGSSGGRADILVKDNYGKSLLIIECKNEGKEYNDAWRKTLQNGGQLFSYVQQAKSTQFVCLYSSDIIDKKTVYYNQIITLKDNLKILEESDGKKLLSYKDAQEVEDIFKAWKETYEQDFATKGIFEKDITAYNIGKHKFSLNDLKKISSNDIQGKYHEFATILRQHNVSGRENAFDKLVNLFLCKIVDETQNADELKFYWKGIAYDSYFDLQDRLQVLYQLGMQEFLGEDVTYIDNSAIDDAFRFVKNDPDATRDTIKRYIRELKFFTNNDFAFIDVHNEKLFYQNSTILLKVIQMLQDIHLKTEEQNQFLGDMFEGFLDQGIKQSEGQFFTPMPIVKFILASLPLEEIIKNSDKVPKVIDYACGAGHFLNEYALQIAPFVEKHKTNDIKKYYPEIVGIEKEYRLSKVAKVSAFMYGQDDIKIIYDDALSENMNVKNGEYSVLVSNPPYSVKGFLETLSESDYNNFELIKTIDEKSFAKNNSIETFFIERTKQLLKPDGVAAIVVPLSILTKGSSKSGAKKQNVYVATREILLKYFDIAAIVKFGSGTFGKTGTNTVTLFLKRKKENPDPADHYKNRIDSWFDNDSSKDGIFDDEHLIEKYCNHLEYSFDDYRTLLEGSPNSNILNTNVFKEYRKDFDSSTEIKNRKKQKSFKNISKPKQKSELDNRFVEYLRNIEKDKLYYFVLASLNSMEVVIVKTPTTNDAEKKFLGYEWSNAKGNEGIKYLAGQTNNKTNKAIDENDVEADLEENDLRVLSNILNLDNIQTPLYDPKDLENSEKINKLISTNFTGKIAKIPENLKEYVTTAKLEDMLDFSRKDFNKSISLVPKKTIRIATKWKVKKLSDLVEVINGGTPKTTVPEYWDGEIPWLSVTDFNNPYRFVYNTEKTITEDGFNNSNTNYLEIGDIIISARGTVGALAQVGIRTTFNQSCYGLRAKKITSNDYMFFILEQQIHQFKLNAHGSKFDSITTQTFEDIKVPFPPLEVQKEIVKSCEKIYDEFENAEKDIRSAKQEIENKVSEIFNQNYPTKKLSDGIAYVNPSKTEIADIDEDTIVSFVEMASVSEAGFISNKEDRILKDLKKGSYTYFRENDIIIAKITPSMENGKCAIATGLTNKIGMGSSEFHVIRVNEEEVFTRYIFELVNREIVRKEAETHMTGSSGHRRVPASFYENFICPIPDKDIQKSLIQQIEQLNAKIKKAQAIIDDIPIRKQAVFEKYL